LPVVVLIICVFSCNLKARDVWVEDSFADFRDGIFDASGQNLYVTAAGKIVNIHRFDLNDDGYLDFMLGNSHDFVHNPAPALFTQTNGRKGSQISHLPMNGSVCGAVADMNKDGFLDLILCPNYDITSYRRYARIFWGGKDGWVRQRFGTLSTILAKAVSIADIDCDGWDDILILNGSRWSDKKGSENVLRIYWGSEESFDQGNSKDILLGAGNSMVVKDLDSDDRPDVAIMQRPVLYDADDKEITDLNSEMLVYWNDDIKQGGSFPKPQRIDLKTDAVGSFEVIDLNKDGRLDFVITGGEKTLFHINPSTKVKIYDYSGLIHVPGTGKRRWGRLVEIQTPVASGFGIGDLNNDGRIDVVLCNMKADKESVTIMWGDANGKFNTRSVKKIDLAKIESVAVDDVDRDGNLDIVASPWRGEDVYESPSRILYGNGKGGFDLADTKITTANVVSIITAPTDSGDGRRLIFCNTNGGRIYEDIPDYIYWGGTKGFDPKRRTEYPNRSSNFSNAADLNNDGYTDLILGACVHAEIADHPELGFNIYWGGKNGPRTDKRTILYEYGLAGTNVADFNKDGWLDLMCTCNWMKTVNDSCRVTIRYGGPKGFEDRKKVVIPSEGAGWSNDVADFNKDGWLDIVFTQFPGHKFSILWGGPEGFADKRRSTYPLSGANNMRTADLNKDGWLDLVVTSYVVAGTYNHDYGTRIYWGGTEGFSAFNAQQLRGYAGFGLTIADYDDDGFLDLYIPNYKMRQIRDSIPSFLYWGSAQGYSDKNFTALLHDSGSGSNSGDFNGDGLIDIAVVCHTRQGSHNVASRVYYNDGNRFNSPQCQLLPGIGPHYTLNADMGNQYDRSYSQTYISSVYKWDNARIKGRLTYKAEVPGRTRLDFAVRCGQTQQQLAEKPWKPIKKKFSLDKKDRLMQYKATFISDNGDRYPSLDTVKVTF